MSPLPVADSLSNRDEHIAELAKRIGKGHKRTVFAEVYRGKRQQKSVAEISEATGLSEKQVLNAGVQLVAAHAVEQVTIKQRVGYAKIPSHKTIKDKVLAIAGNMQAIESIPTKRNPRLTISGRLFVPARRSGSSQSRPKTKRTSSFARVAFLLASPAGAGAINVGMDFREAEDAVRASAGRDKLELRAFPAAHVGTLLDALNEYRPDVVHFSGHGGEEAVLFDGADVRNVGGVALDFGVARKMLAATDSAPKLLVLAACQTVSGADIFLDTVPIVIAMSHNISDWAAAYFSRRFYAALVSGQSILNAFNQAKAYLEAERLPDAVLPTLLNRDVDVSKSFIVGP
jgi:hypothetical protein